MKLKNTNPFMYNLVRAGDTVEILDENIANAYMQNGFICVDDAEGINEKKLTKKHISVKKIVDEHKDL